MTPDPITALATALPAIAEQNTYNLLVLPGATLVMPMNGNSNNIVYGNTYPTVTVTYTTPATMPIDG